MSSNQKDYINHKFNIVDLERGVLGVSITLVMSDDANRWKGFRHLVALGLRLDGYLKGGLIDIEIMEHLDFPKVVLTAGTRATRKEVEEAFHSLYLFMEYPEKYA